MKEDLTALLSEKIFITQDAQELTVDEIPMSNRLRGVFGRMGFATLGALNGITFSEIYSAKNCGLETTMELSDLLAKLRSPDLRQELITNQKNNNKRAIKFNRPTILYIPQNMRGIAVPVFLFSTRLAKLLTDLDIRILGDLHNLELSLLMRRQGCGSGTIDELQAFVESLQTHSTQTDILDKIAVSKKPLSLLGVMEFIDQFLAEGSKRDRKMILERFGGVGNHPLTLEEIGQSFGLTRERVRQIESKNLKLLKERLATRARTVLCKLKRDCLESLSFLTPQLLTTLLRGETKLLDYPIPFYIRLLAELDHDLPVLPLGQISPGSLKSKRANEIGTYLRRFLRQRYEPCELIEIFEDLRSSVEGLSATEFLDVVKSSNFLSLIFDTPEKPTAILIGKRRASEVAYHVLSESEVSMTSEEILLKAKEIFGEDAVDFSPRSMKNIFYYTDGIYSLDTDLMGLRKHFRLPEEKWKGLRNDFYQLLEKNNRSFSTTEVINLSLFPWAESTNATEAAQILREDKRFTDLGRFHFALASWAIEERELLYDLIIRVLTEAGHPLKATEILAHLKRFRSVSQASISLLRHHEEVEDFGFGFYGLKTLKGSREYLISNMDYVNRTISRSQPPLIFEQLCQKLGVLQDEYLFQKVWQTLTLLKKVKPRPFQMARNTLIIHENWSLQRALYSILADSGRPLSLLEISWDLKRLFADTFEGKRFERVKNCLKSSILFVRNNHGEYLLDTQINQNEIDVADICQTCFEILSEENRIIGTEEILDRLGDEGIESQDISPEMLSVLLRNDGLFEEITPNFFIIKK